MGLPLICNGRSLGVFLVTRREEGSLMNRPSRCSSASPRISPLVLENFERAGERARPMRRRAIVADVRRVERHQRSNHARRSRTEPFELVSEAAVVGGTSPSTAIVLSGPAPNI